MPLKNTASHHGSLSKWLHWGIAFIVVGMLAAGFYMANTDSSPLRTNVSNLHKSFGILIILLMLLRLGWRFANITPTLPRTMPQWEQIAARLVHYLFYIVLIAMPLSGWLMGSAAGRPPEFFGLFVLPSIAPESRALAGFFREIHGFIAWSLVILIALHVLAALKHHFLDKNDVLRRMLW